MTSPALDRPIRARWDGIGHDLLAAAVVSLSAISSYVSGATLLFQGALRPHLALAVGAALLGGAVMSLWAAARSSFPLASAGPSLSSVPVMGAVTVGIAAEVPAASLMPTAVMAIALTALVIGVGWWVMGRRQWGDVARYLPYPVVGGFIASVGWLSFVGGLGVVSGQPFEVQHALRWLAVQGDARLAAGLVIGFVLVVTMRRVRHPLALPAAIVGLWLALLVILRASGLDADAARRAGWLLEPLGRTLPAWPGDPALLGQVRWLALAHGAGLMLSAFIVSTISLLLSTTSLEHAWAERADVNRDLRAFGQANVLLGLIGGLPGELSVSRSVLNRAGGATSRGAGYGLAAICLATLIWGGPALSLLPRPLLGGLLVYQGLSVLGSWLWDARSRLPWPDIATMASMVVATALFGFLAAVSVGLLACCVSFAVASARLAPVRRLVSRAQWPSQVERAPAEVALLREAGQQALIVELQGALFFGSATRLTRDVEALLHAARPPARLLFDFQHVRWVDSSAAQALARLFDQARRCGVAAEASRLSGDVRQALERAGALAAGDLAVHEHIDAAVSAWDDAVLARAGLVPLPLHRWLARALPNEAAVAQLLDYFEPLALAAGERLFARGDLAESMYLVEAGRMIAVVDSASGPRTVRTVSAGGFVGEMGLFRAVPRSAEVRAERPSRLLQLRGERLRAMERDRPDLAAAVYGLFVRQLADRLEQSTTQLAALV